jgi:tetratricopeptide (TPR) repeat protein
MNALARGSIYALAASIALSLAACSETIGAIGPSSHIAEMEAGPRDQESNSGNLASLTEVIARNPSDAAAYNTRGVVYAKLGRYSNAIDDFSHAIELDPHFAGAYTTALSPIAKSEGTTLQCKISIKRSPSILRTLQPTSAAGISFDPKTSSTRRVQT